MALLLVFLTQTLMADASDPEQKIRDKLATLVPGMEPDTIKATPIKGLYEVVYGAQIMYFSADARYMVQGNLLDLDVREDLTEKTRGKARVKVLEKVSEDEMIIFSPAKSQHTITVFTDIDCPYCRKLHAEMEEYNKAGIKVRYLLFPRTGINSPSFNKAVSVWCAEDSNKALTDAKQGKEVEAKTCENPIEDQITLGQMVGVTGTPAIILEGGELLPGYRPAKQMSAMLDGLTANDGKKSISK
jgi:thiol:disulfide interchange protein DsbC